jgi:hypothetical protein
VVEHNKRKRVGAMSLSESGVSASWSALSSQLPPALAFTLQPRPTDSPQIHAMAFNARKRCRSDLSHQFGLTCGSVLVSKLSSAGTDVSKPPFHQSRQLSHPPLSRFRQGVYAVCGEPERFLGGDARPRQYRMELETSREGLGGLWHDMQIAVGIKCIYRQFRTRLLILPTRFIQSFHSFQSFTFVFICHSILY